MVMPRRPSNKAYEPLQVHDAQDDVDLEEDGGEYGGGGDRAATIMADDGMDPQQLQSRFVASRRKRSYLLGMTAAAVVGCFVWLSASEPRENTNNNDVAPPAPPSTSLLPSAAHTEDDLPPPKATTMATPLSKKEQIRQNLFRHLEECQKPQNKCAMFSMKDSGLGSQLVNLFAQKLYLRDVFGYTDLLVESLVYDGYYRPDGEPVLTGYFTPQPDIGIMNDPADVPYLTPLLPPDFNLTEWDKLDWKARYRPIFKDLAMNNDGKAVGSGIKNYDLVAINHVMFHKMTRDWIKKVLGYKGAYRKLVPVMCPHLQFNDVVQQEMKQWRQQNLPSLPADLRQAKQPNAKAVPRSIGFHVRRSDKVSSGESKFFPAKRYVKLAAEVLRNETIPFSDIEFCVLMTDDNTVYDDMQQALENAGFSCQLVYPPSTQADHTTNAGAKNVRYESDAGFSFLTQVSILTEVNYLFGTFGSNVLALVAILRGCPSTGYDLKANYAHTYGVDRPHWYFR